MDPETLRRVMDVFREVCGLSEPARSQRVEALCGEDAALRAHVLELLEHDRDPSGPIATAGGREPLFTARATAENAAAASSAERVPAHIGPYRVVRRIGEGGMGVVYEAEQSSPRRAVALKLLRSLATSSEVLRRFEHEAEILGRLHHPGIAQIYEAGVAEVQETRQAFIAMELVHGAPLTVHARAEQLGISARIEQIVRVCDAVQHAHRRGVIHRDLKPANILVDEQGQPKVLDFGVARAVDGESALSTMHTRSGQLIGTLPYMSPEQVAGDPEEIDTRTDVYSLGVVLFEILSERLPRDVAGLSLVEAARSILETAPLSLAALDRRFRGELDTIASKALASDKARRYQSAGDLGDDLRRFLAGEPILARRDSAIYLLRKTMQRHKVAVGAIAVFFALVSFAAIALGIAYGRQSSLLTELGVSSIAERDARERAVREAARAKAIHRFVHEMLASNDPSIAKGAQITVRQVLDRTAEEIERGSLAATPDIEAAIRLTLGETYRALSLYEPAEVHLRHAVRLADAHYGAKSPELVSAALALAGVLFEQHEPEEAMALVQRSREICESQHLADEGLYAQALVRYADLANMLGHPPREAEEAFREAIAIYDRAYGRVNPYTAAALSNLGKLFLDYFRYADAERAMREAYELALVLHGRDHRVSILNANNLAAVLVARDDAAGARSIAEPAFESACRVLGVEHAETARLAQINSELALQRGETAEAERLARISLQGRRISLGEDHELFDLSTLCLCDALAASGDAEKAAASAAAIEALLASAPRCERLGWCVDEARSILAVALAALRRPEDAEALAEDAFERIQVQQGPRSRPAKRALERAIRVLEASGATEKTAHYRALRERFDQQGAGARVHAPGR